MATHNIQDGSLPLNYEEIKSEESNENSTKDYHHNDDDDIKEFEVPYVDKVDARNNSYSSQNKGSGSNTGSNPSNDVKVQYEIKSSNKLIYQVCDVPPLRVSVVVALQQSLLSISSSFTVGFLLADLVCAGKNDILKAKLVCSIMFISGLTTFLQNNIGIRLPLYQGPTIEYILPLLALKDSVEWNCDRIVADYWNQTSVTNETVVDTSVVPDEVIYSRIQMLQCSLIIIGTLHFLIGATGLVGIVFRYIGPVTITPALLLIGFYLFKVIVKFSETHWGISLATSSMSVILSMYLAKYKLPIPAWSRANGFHIKRTSLHATFSMLIGIIFGWILCGILTQAGLLTDDKTDKQYNARTDSKLYVLGASDWFFFPYPGCFGFSVNISISTLISFLIATLASVVDSIADYYACAKICDVPIPPNHSVNRGIAIEGLATVYAGSVGIGHGTSTYGGNIGAIAITRVASRRVFQIVGVIYMLFGIVGKIGAFFVTIPMPVLGGVQLIYFGSFIGVVLSNMHKVRMNHRNMTIIGVSIIFGVTIPAWSSKHPEEFATGYPELDRSIHAVFTNPNFLGGLIAMVLDNIWPGTLEERGLAGSVEDLSEEDGKPKNSKEKEEESVYGIPYLPKFIARNQFLRFLAFMPPYHIQRHNTHTRDKEEEF
ncbi:solute carrier family 23 member 1-like isoform X1 [Argonauta hians]